MGSDEHGGVADEPRQSAAQDVARRVEVDDEDVGEGGRRVALHLVDGAGADEQDVALAAGVGQQVGADGEFAAAQAQYMQVLGEYGCRDVDALHVVDPAPLKQDVAACRPQPVVVTAVLGQPAECRECTALNSLFRHSYHNLSANLSIISVKNKKNPRKGHFLP